MQTTVAGLLEMRRIIKFHLVNAYTRLASSETGYAFRNSLEIKQMAILHVILYLLGISLNRLTDIQGVYIYSFTAAG